jgi:hypothetical protein
MAYQGRKVFVAGQVLTASDMNSTVDQTVMVFADSSARDTAIPSPTEGMVVYLESDNEILKYTGASWDNIQSGISVTANRAIESDGSGALVASDVTATELNFLDGVTSSIQAQFDNPLASFVTDATTARTLTSSDMGKTIRFTSGSATVVTVNASTDFTVGARVDIIADGAGEVTVAASSATVAGAETSTTSGSFTIGAQYSAATLLCVATDEYRLIGNVAVV